MKYIAIIDTDNELTEDAIKNLVNDTVFIGDEAASYCFTMTSIRQVSEVATNGDMIKVIFPDAEIRPIMGHFDKDELLGHRVYLVGGGRSQDYYLDWWNAPYKKEVKE